MNSSGPFFEQFWLLGNKTREAGSTREEAQEFADHLFTSRGVLNLIPRVVHFSGKYYVEAGPASSRWYKVMSNAISATYMDGYDGVN
ncbi:Exc2 family lipoprotein [Xenorhabdus sp. 42]|uniref:Exc2 family lipoprotein n=1 Tax=Xenorhabdus szentirmaii TaxID=290112 RepID=UPI00199F74DB|nr:Exc2 family lipoprotein [Xenorhabdus sp. 42]